MRQIEVLVGMVGIVGVIGAGGCKRDAADAPSPTVAAPAPAPVTSVRRVRQSPTARPELPPIELSSAMLWATAEQLGTADGWDAAARALRDQIDACDEARAEGQAQDTPECTESRYAYVRARSNAALIVAPPRPTDTKPAPLPPAIANVVAAIDEYTAAAAADDPEVAGMKFVAANELRNWNQPDCVDRLTEVIALRDDVSEYAANIMLDYYMQNDRGDDFRRLVTELLADTTFLDAHPDLRDTLEHVKSL